MGKEFGSSSTTPTCCPTAACCSSTTRACAGSPFGQSRVLEIDLFTHEIYWDYKGTSPDHLFDSWIRGAQQRLPNGNTLITNRNAAACSEVAPAGEIAWEYYNPDRAEYKANPCAA